MEVTTKKARQSGEENLENNSKRSNCLSKWWNQTYLHQKFLLSALEHPLFHLLITILVILECGAVIGEILLHQLKSQYECKKLHMFYVPREYFNRKVSKIDHAMKICHYISLSILSLFIFELFLKMYALGYHYWNCKENHKLDYFDAFLVVFSFSVEVYFLTVDKESILAYSAILIVVLRLWHLIRIANG